MNETADRSIHSSDTRSPASDKLPLRDQMEVELVNARKLVEELFRNLEKKVEDQPCEDPKKPQSSPKDKGSE